MNRLTREQLENYRNTYDRFDGIESNEFEKICDELIEYKALEEELGISLPILFKAIKNGIIVESDDEKDELDGWRLSISFEQKCFVFANFFGRFGIYFEDYGKTWWLKEDLKSE